MNKNSHSMTTRSKIKKDIDPPHDNFDDEIIDDEIDENGNLKGFIDYDCDEDFDQKEFDQILDRCMRNDVERNYRKKDRVES